MANKHPYYDFTQALSYNATFNFIVGARGLGKTYGMQKRVIKRAIEHDELFVWVRRYREELALSKNTFFDAIGLEFPDYDFRVQGWEAQYAHIDTADDKKREWKTAGYFIPLSVAQSMKSVSFRKVHTIVFDEFIIEKGHIQYLRGNEARTFVNLYSTVDRNNDRVKVWFLANSVSMMNPYFLEYNIRPDQMPEISTKADGFILVHFPDSDAFKKSVSNTRFGRFISGTEYEEYAVGNKFADNHNALLEVKPSSAIYQYTLETAIGVFSLWFDRKTNSYYAQEKLPKTQNYFTLVAEKMSTDKVLVTFQDKNMSYLRTAFRQGRVLFDKPKSRNAFIEVFKR